MVQYTPDTETVRRIRTFADDVQRAQGETDATHEFASVAPNADTPQREAGERTAQPTQATDTRSAQQPTPIEVEMEQYISSAKTDTPEKPPAQIPPTTQASERTKDNTPLQTTRDEEDIEDASTIVKDTVRKRWSLKNALKESFSSWLGDTRDKFQDMTGRGEEVQPDVAPAASRAEIIQKAGSQSSIAPQDDYENVVSNLRTKPRAEAAAAETPQPKKKEAEAAGWTHMVGQALGATETKQQPQSIKRARPSITPEGSTPQRNRVMSNQRDAIAPVQQRRLPEEEYDGVQPVKKQSEQMETQERSGSMVRTFRDDALSNVKERGLSVPQIAAAQAEQRARRKQEAAGQEKSKRGLPIILTASAVVALLLGGGTAYLFFLHDDEVTPAVTGTSVPSFIANVNQEAISFSDDRAELMQSMTNVVSALTRTNGVLVQLYPTRASGAEGAAVSTGVFMSVLDPRTNGSFVRSLRDTMMFGAYTGTAENAPFFIFKTEQFDVALAGMLGWEETMSSDLSPLFGPPVTETREPTSTSTHSARFSDDTLRNTNVRILYDAQGEPHILYAFPNKETLVITSTVEAMVTLIERLRG